MSKTFKFAPPVWLAFKDQEVIERVRSLTREEMLKLSQNEKLKVKIVHDVQSHFVADLFYRIHRSDRENKKLTVVLPNPYAPAYINVANMCNKYRVSCRNLNVFFLNEWADEEGNVASSDYERGMARSFFKYFYERLDSELRPAVGQIHCFKAENVLSYSDMIDECAEGGADVIYSSVSWTGGIASIEPSGDFEAASMDDYLKLTSRIVTPTPESIAECSMMGTFGFSGDIAAVPPRAATIGPRDIAHARDHVEIQYRGPMGLGTSWQRLISRIMLYGPITKDVPASILRLFDGVCYVSEDIAKPVVLPLDIDPLTGKEA